MSTVLGLLCKQATTSPDAIAMMAPGRIPLTYQQLLVHTHQVVDTLNQMGIGRHDKVAIVLPNGPDMASAFLSITAGAISAPLNPAYSAKEFDFYLSDLGAKALVIQADLDSPARQVAQAYGIPIIDCLPQENAGLFTLSGDANRIPSTNTKALNGGFTKPDDVALVLHTSGTTSTPKMVPLTHLNVCTSAQNIADTLQLTKQDRCLNVMPLFHIHGLIATVLSPLMAGGTLICTPGFDVERFFTWMEEFEPTWYTAVPTIHQAILADIAQRQATPTHALRFIRSSSASLPPKVMTGLEEAFNAPVIESYGMTEASHQMTSNPLPPKQRKTGSVGIAAGPEVAIMDEAESGLFNVEQVGEVVIRGKNITQGYTNNDEANRKAFSNGWFRTGDQGYFDPDGFLFITGRLKEMINRGGEKIAPREIDEVLLAHPLVNQAITFAVPHESLGEDVVAAVILEKSAAATEGELRKFAFSQLADFKVPTQILLVDEIPKGATGKLQRIGLAHKFADQLKPGYIEPSGKTEKALAAIWVNALGTKQIGRQDNFFALGGDSLIAAKLVAEVRQTLGIELSLPIVFQQPTLADLASAIETMQPLVSSGSSNAGDFHLPSIVVTPAEQYLPFPLTPIQQAYWIGRGDVFELGQVSTHLYMEVEAVALDLERLNHALQLLISRHSMLRAIVLPDGRQQILEEVPAYAIQCLDLRELEPEQVREKLQAVQQQMSHQVITADQWPLFEVRATLLNERQTKLHFSFDALTLDAWSRTLLLQEWQQLYNNPKCKLEALEVSFRDYVITEQRFQTSALYQRAQDYWLSRLDALPPAPDLPKAISQSQLRHPHFTRRTKQINSRTWSLLKQQAKQSSLTASVILLTAYAQVLRLWSTESSFTINLTVFNRPPHHPQINQILGDFTSSLLLAIEPSQLTTFNEQAAAIQQQLWTDLDHRYISGVEVMREMARKDGNAPRAMMPIVFTNYFGPANSTREAPFDWLGDVSVSVSQTPQVSLDLIVAEEGGELMVHWNAVDELFPEGMMADMFTAYCDLLHRLADDRSNWQTKWLERAQELTPDKDVTLNLETNSTQVHAPNEHLHTLFAKQVKRRTDHPAVIGSQRTLSYSQLYSRANQVAHVLRELGSRPNHLIAVVMDKGWEQVVAVLGVLTSGAGYLPIDASVPQERLWHILEDGEVEVIITQQWLDDELSWPENIQRMVIDSPSLLSANDNTLDVIQSTEDLAYVIYTSGSTGLPKGVMINHCGAVNTIRDINQRFNVGVDDRILALSSLAFDLSVYDIFGTLAAGGTIIMPDKKTDRDPASWLALLQKQKITLWNSVPALMTVLVEYCAVRSELLPNSLRLIMMSGDWIPITLPDRIRTLQPSVELISMGGATEASIWSIIYPIKEVDPKWTKIPYGKPMLNQTFHVLNETLEPCPVWVIGELYIGGMGLTMGYWHDPDKTDASLLKHPHTGERLYKTGDMGCRQSDGNIEFLGRTDSQIKIQGYRIELGEIEQSLLQHPSVKEAVVTTSGDTQHKKRLIAYIVCENPPPGTTWLSDFLQQKIPAYMLPTAFVYLDNLPLTSNGKINRLALPMPSNFDSTLECTTTPMSTDYQKVKALVQDILKVENIDAHTNLLSLGATSIDMIRIVNQMEKEFIFRADIGDFYSNPTIAAFSNAYQTYKEQPFFHTKPLNAYTPAQLTDPEERDAFKKRQPALRQDLEQQPSIELIAIPEEQLRESYRTRCSYRKFKQSPIPFKQFSYLLGSLRQGSISGEPKYLYPSAGGLYPIQIYLCVKEQRIAGLSAGTYYYHPTKNCLVQLNESHIEKSHYGSLTNRSIFEEAAFALYMVGQLEAITPMYGERARDFCLLEAGAILQILQMTAPEYQIGLVPIGHVSLQDTQQLLGLAPNQILLHSLLGGRIDNECQSDWQPMQEVYDETLIGNDYETMVL